MGLDERGDDMKLMVLLLLLSLTFTPILSFGQQVSVEEQARTDATKDAENDLPKELLMITGFGVGSVGFFAGFMGGCYFGIVSFRWEEAEKLAYVGAALCGFLALPIVANAYPHTAAPPVDRMLGKSPGYIAAYTEIYRKETIKRRKRALIAGNSVGGLAALGLHIAMMRD